MRSLAVSIATLLDQNRQHLPMFIHGSLQVDSSAVHVKDSVTQLRRLAQGRLDPRPISSTSMGPIDRLAAPGFVGLLDPALSSVTSS